MPMPKAYDIDDVEASFVAGDDQALRRAYDAHGRLVYTLCRRSLGSDAATDVTQEVFAAGWFARRQYDPSRGSLGGWLVGSVPGNIRFDSLAVTASGKICVATIMTGGIAEFWPDGSQVRHHSLPDLHVTNLAFGGEGMQTAYVTYSQAGALVAIRWHEAGLILHDGIRHGCL